MNAEQAMTLEDEAKDYCQANMALDADDPKLHGHMASFARQVRADTIAEFVRRMDDAIDTKDLYTPRQVFRCVQAVEKDMNGKA